MFRNLLTKEMSNTTLLPTCPWVRACEAVKITHSFSHVISKLFHLIISACLCSSTPNCEELFVTQSQNWTNGRFLNLQSFLTNHDSWFNIQLNCHPSLENDLSFCLSLFAATVSMPCICTRHKKLCESKIQQLLFAIRWNE